MTPDEFLQKMQEIKQNHFDDVEIMHVCADDLLCEVLSSLGYEKGVEVFDDMEKWYA